MYANVLQKACIRCGLCPTICPEVFHLPDTGESARAITQAYQALGYRNSTRMTQYPGAPLSIGSRDAR